MELSAYASGENGSLAGVYSKVLMGGGGVVLNVIKVQLLAESDSSTHMLSRTGGGGGIRSFDVF